MSAVRSTVPRPAAPVGRPPGPGGSAWVSFARYLRDPLGMMESLRAEYGPVAFVRFPGGHSFFFMTDAMLIRRVLVEDHALFVKGRALQAARRLLGDGLLTSEGTDHLRRRRLIQPIFGSAMIDGYAAAMVECSEAASRRWRDGAETDVNADMMRLALAIVGRTIFDADVESEAPEIRRVLDAGMRVFHRFLLPGADVLWRLPLPATRRFEAAKAGIDVMIARMIAERRGRPAAGQGLLDHLLALRAGDGTPLLSDAEIRDEAITLMLAGHETTAQALTWTWHLLAAAPDARHRLDDELATVLGGRAPAASDLPELPFAGAIVREALRLYPPVWALARIAKEPYALGPYAIPKGGTIITSQWVVQRCADYFQEPLSFRPSRWIDGPAPQPGSYFPFAGGPRMCIGERFALLEATLALATLAQRWHVVPLDPRPQIDPRFTLRPRGGLRAVTRARRVERHS
jgi:cytochrome P450